MTAAPVDRPARIAAAIATAWDAAGLAPDEVVPRIIPLDRLVRSFPLAVEEVQGLTRRSAAGILSARSGTLVSAPAAAGDVPLAGYLYAYPLRSTVQGYILVEQQDIIERRRFSVAHELGHYLLHFLPRIEQKQQAGLHLNMTESLSYRPGDDEAVPTGEIVYTRAGGAPVAPHPSEQQAMEVEANHFAAELLMPARTCLALVARFGSRANPRRLATELLVSPAAMGWRLKSLGIGSATME